METKNILIVEDDPDNKILLEEIINYCSPDCSCTSVDNGEEALEVTSKAEFDLIFMDMSMPKKNGFEVISELRKDTNYKTVPVVALTAHAMKGAKEKILNSGFDEYISKPCKPVDLIDVLKKYIKSKEKLILS